MRWAMGTLLTAILVWCGVAAPAAAQETRVGVIEEQLAARARNPPQERRGTIERAMLYVEENRLIARLTTPRDGFYPRLGGLSTGSGLAVGPGYRKYFTRDGLFDISGAVSTRGYKQVDARLHIPSVGGGRIRPDVLVRWRDYTQERFFGLGPHTRRDTRTAYRLTDLDSSFGIVLQPSRVFSAAARVGYQTPDIGAGRGRHPSIESRFTEATAPGLLAQPDFLHATAALALDYTDYPDNPRAGGRHRVSFARYHDRNLDRFSFNRFEAEAMQLLSFFDRRRIIALRALVALTDADAGHRVPFFYMPAVGGPESLRGFRRYRFRDNNALVLNAEYRWEVFAALDMALFYDAGTVAPRREALRLSDLETAYGIGLRLSTRNNVLLRFDVGRGREGTRYFVKFAPAF